jgi:ATP-dependent DNA ligase
MCETWINGAVGAPDYAGILHLHLAQQAFSEDTGRLIYYAFDLLLFDQVDLRSRPVENWRALLWTLLKGFEPDTLRYGASIKHVSSLFASACAAGLEGRIEE